MMTTAVSILALVVAFFALWVSADKLRLDLYNKRFDIYLRTLKFQQPLLRARKEDGTFAALQTDFMIACRESIFLFSPRSGVYDQLRKLHEASAAIVQDIPNDLPREKKSELEEKHSDAIVLWSDPGLEKLENLMKPYLKFHKVGYLRLWPVGIMRGQR